MRGGESSSTNSEVPLVPMSNAAIDFEPFKNGIGAKTERQSRHPAEAALATGRVAPGELPDCQGRTSSPAGSTATPRFYSTNGRMTGNIPSMPRPNEELIDAVTPSP